MAGLGPRFAIKARASREWTDAASATELVLVTESAHEAFLVEILSPAFREALLRSSDAAWVFLAQIVREDSEDWYGFATAAERTLFNELRDLDSIGPKTAALALASLGAAHWDDLLVGRVPKTFKVAGLGPKTLERLALGVKMKSDKFRALLGPSREQALPAPTNDLDLPERVVAGLEKLGIHRDDLARIAGEGTREGIDWRAMAEGEAVRQLLQRWGQYRARSLVKEGQA